MYFIVFDMYEIHTDICSKNLIQFYLKDIRFRRNAFEKPVKKLCNIIMIKSFVHQWAMTVRITENTYNTLFYAVAYSIDGRGRNTQKACN